jgi:DnaK suppressor protein
MAKKDNKKAVKKQMAKPAAKKVVKPVAKKVVKPAAKKVVKPVAKKTVKPVAKKVVKPVAKKVVAKKPSKPVAKVAVKAKVVAKPVAKSKPIKKEVVKETKKPNAKPVNTKPIVAKKETEVKNKIASKSAVKELAKKKDAVVKKKGKKEEDDDEEEGDLPVDEYEKNDDDDVSVDVDDVPADVDLGSEDIPEGAVDLDDDDDEVPIKRGRGRRKKETGNPNSDRSKFIRQQEVKIDLTRNLLQKRGPNEPKPFINHSDTRTRYSDEELGEFKELIIRKLAEAKADYDLLKSTLSNKDNHGTDDTSPTFKLLEDGSDVLSKEETAQLAQRQEKYIVSLQNALIRIENKTYGICRVTGKLIPKERLRSVPHATLGIDAKLNQYTD